ncbi:MAG: hypothetical protein ACK6BG_05125 [Cyanobacteriota bacterium]
MTGADLLGKVAELGEISKAELVRGCGYGIATEGGGERLDFIAFHSALMAARGEDPSDLRQRLEQIEWEA